MTRLLPALERLPIHRDFCFPVPDSNGIFQRDFGNDDTVEGIHRDMNLDRVLLNFVVAVNYWAIDYCASFYYKKLINNALSTSATIKYNLCHTRKTRGEYMTVVD